jgi:hypothetical protein
MLRKINDNYFSKFWDDSEPEKIYYRLQAKLNICVKYTVHKTQLAENKNREIKNKLRAKLRMKKNFQC